MITKYIDRIYKSPPCWGLVSDIYINELGFKVNDYSVQGGSPRSASVALRLALHNNEHGLTKVSLPEDYCVVLMGATNKLGLHHCGVYYKGRVLHALPSGNVYQDMSSLGDTYKLIEYWAKR